MTILTVDEVRQLSRSFRDVSVELGKYLDQHWAEIPRSSGKRLEELQAALLNQAQLLNVTALRLRVDEAQASLAKLNGVTAEAKHAVEQLDDVRKVIKVATATLQLAAAVVSRDLGGIASSIGNLHGAVKA